MRFDTRQHRTSPDSVDSAFRVQREQVLAKPECGLDPGRPEASFSLELTELREETESELQHVRQDKARLEAQLQAALQQVERKGRWLLWSGSMGFCLVWWMFGLGSVGILLCVLKLKSERWTVIQRRKGLLLRWISDHVTALVDLI